jgi:hypothetical protein
VVRCYFDAGKRDGPDQQVSDGVRMMAREMAERHADPSLVVLGSSSVRAAAGAPTCTTVLDAAKKSPGAAVTPAHATALRHG